MACAPEIQLSTVNIIKIGIPTCRNILTMPSVIGFELNS